MDIDTFRERLSAGDIDGAWTMFLERYRPLLMAVVRRYVADYDDAMDMFAHICERLRDGDMARVRRFDHEARGRASFQTWMVVVVRHLAVDWIRSRNGRSRAHAPDELSPLGQRIYSSIFIEGLSHREAMERALAESNGQLRVGAYLDELRRVHAVAFESGSRQLQRVRIIPQAAAHDALAGSAHDDVDQLVGAEARRILQESLHALDADVRLAVQLFVIDGMPAADIARRLDWGGAKTVYNRVYRALAAIRQRFSDRGLGPDDV